jgi:hypothetical protein
LPGNCWLFSAERAGSRELFGVLGEQPVVPASDGRIRRADSTAHRYPSIVGEASNAASGINYRTAQRIVEAAAEHQERKLAAVS